MKTTLSDRLSLYLPIVLMGLLALGSWWLVRSAPRPLAAQAVALPENQQDYTVEDFSTQQFAADGHLTSQIWGQQARHYLQADILEIDQVRTRSQGAQGVLTTKTRAERPLFKRIVDGHLGAEHIFQRQGKTFDQFGHQKAAGNTIEHDRHSLNLP